MRTFSTKHRAVAILLILCMIVTTFSGVTASAARGDRSENTAQSRPSDEVLERLRAGELSKAEVDALIKEGLTVADLQDPYAVSPLAIVDDENDRVDPKWFNFVVSILDYTLVCDDYDDLKEFYRYLPDTWDGPLSREQVDEYGNYYQEYNDDATYAGLYYPHLDGRENGIEYQVKRVSYHDTSVYHIGNVVIPSTEGEQHYTYVSSERTTGAASHFILPDDAKITVEYGPREYQVFYQVVVDGVSAATADETFGSHAIFGDARPTTTTEQAVNATVTIPVGYYARVYIGDFADHRNKELFPSDFITYAQSKEAGNHVANKPGMTTEYEKFPLEEGYGNYPLGMGPNFIKDVTTEKNVDDESHVAEAIILDTTANRETPGFFSTTATYTSGEKGSADANQLIRVVLAKRTEFTVSNQIWGATHTGEFIQQNKIKGNLLGGERKIFTTKDANGNYILDTSKYGGDSGYVEPTGVTINEDGSYNFTWTFTTKTHKTWLYELRTLSINGENLEVPFIANPSAEVVASEARRSAETEEQQITGATVQVRVTAVDTATEEYAADGGTNFYGDRYQRKYEIIFTNVTRNIIVTTSALALQKNDEFIASTLTGVDLQLWSGEKASNFNWGKAEQGQSFHVAQNFNWNSDSYGTYNGGKYNARFKIQNGYELKEPAPEDDRDGAEILASVTYATKLGEEQAVAGVAGPDESGWYYLNLPNTAGSTTYVIFIEADLMQYRVNYLDGVTTGRNLQRGVHGLPDGETITGMPDFSAWNHGGNSTVDNNAGNYYNLIANNTIRIDASTPTDTPANPADRPAAFQYWVLTDAEGTPVDHDKNPIVDKSQYFTVKGDELRQLADVASAAYKDDDGIYTFYLTAYWEPPADPFTYYITFNTLNKNGQQEKDVYHPNNVYPMVDANDNPIDGAGAPLRYAANGRYTYAKVSSSTVVFDPDSTLVADYKATALWDKLDTATNGDYLYRVVNYGEVPVWFVYTLGGLTIENKTAVDARLPDPTFTYTVTFTLPADDPDTAGNEAAFFGTNSYTIGSTKGPVSLTSKGGRTYEGAVTLAANESVTFDDLPAGTTYTVQQTNASAGYFESAEVQHTTTARPTATNTAAAKDTGAIAARYSDVVKFENEAATGNLTVSKAVAGTGANQAKSFTFVVTLHTDETDKAGTVAKGYTSQRAATKTDAKNVKTTQTVSFQNGVATFTLRHGESLTISDLPAHVYYTLEERDNAGYTVRYADSATGEITEGKPALVAVTNTYAPKGTTLAVTVNKAVDYVSTPPNETFHFTLAAASNPRNGATLPGSTGLDLAYTAAIDANRSRFGNITFTLPGVYTFTVTETKGSTPGYTYVTTPKTIQVTVVEVNGALQVMTITVDGKAVTAGNAVSVDFTNIYAVTPTTYAPKVTKAVDMVDGDNAPDATFTFTLAADAGNPDGAILPADTEVEIAYPTDTEAAFGDITFTSAGTYRFALKETLGDAAGYHYDNTEWLLTVVVVDDGSELKVDSVNYSSGAAANSAAAAFTNEYYAKSVRSDEVVVTKKLDGRALKAGEFEFEISTQATDGIRMPNAKTVKNAADGEVSFGSITFTAAGDYTVTIREVIPADAVENVRDGVTYDAHSVEITYTVTDIGGQLRVESATSGNTTFVNTYAAKPVTATPAVTKELRNGTLAADAFEFALSTADTAGIALPTTKTATNTAEGKVVFEDVTFTAPGEYTVTITETVPDGAVNNIKNNVKYDTHTATITYTVTDGGKGQLEVTSQAKDTVFVNENVENAVPGLDVTKTETSVGPYASGDTVTWAITVTNTGNVRLENIKVTDELQNVTLDKDVIESLEPNTGATVTATYTATATDVSNGKVVNTATVSAPNPVNPDQTAKLEAQAESTVNTFKKSEGTGSNTPGGGTSGGGTSGSGDPSGGNTSVITPPPTLNTVDHYAYIIGTGDGLAQPEAYITRAEVITIFFRLLKDETRAEYWSTTNPYLDVSADAWYNNAISTMANMGIVNGYPDGTFRPGNPITRAELTKIAVSFFNFAATKENTFPDVPNTHWAYSFIQAAAEIGLVKGLPDGSFHPNDNITRAETVTIVNRVLGRKPHSAGMPNGMILWRDNLNKNAWYYADMQEATNSHEYEMDRKVGGTLYETWTKLLPVRDWAALERQWSDSHSAPGGEVMGED